MVRYGEARPAGVRPGVVKLGLVWPAIGLVRLGEAWQGMVKIMKKTNEPAKTIAVCR